MLATLLASISSSFSSTSNLSWYATIYFIAGSASQALSGQLSDIFGRHSLLLFCHIVFLTGTLICGLAHREWVFLFGRAVQGFGGAPLSTITTFVESDLVPLRNRGVVEGTGNVFYGVVLAVGGVYGGGVNDALGWRWAFLIQAPFIVAATVMIFFVVGDSHGNHKAAETWQRIDYVGAFSFVTTLVLFQLGINAGGTQVPWTSPLVTATLPISLLSLIVFTIWDLRFTKHPLIPIRVMVKRTVASACLTYMFTNMAYFSILFFLPIYLQVLSLSTTETGVRFIAQAAGIVIASFAAGIIVKMTGRYYYLNLAIQVVFVVGFALITTLNLTSPVWAPFVYLGIIGLGFGGQLVVTLVALLSSIDANQQATVTSASYSFRAIGITLGPIVSTAVFLKVLNRHLSQSAAAGQQGDLSGVLKNDFDALRNLEPAAKTAATQCYMQALKAVFFLALGEMGVAAVASLLMRENFLPKVLRR